MKLASPSAIYFSTKRNYGRISLLWWWVSFGPVHQTEAAGRINSFLLFQGAFVQLFPGNLLRRRGRAVAKKHSFYKGTK